MALNAKTMTNKELFYGHKACPGCGAALAIRLALKVLGERTIAVIPPNCMSTVAFIYPHMPMYVNGMIPPFAGTAAAMSGILAGAKAQGLEDYHVVGFAGDGGTADIGLQALSGMIDRNGSGWEQHTCRFTAPGEEFRVYFRFDIDSDGPVLVAEPTLTPVRSEGEL